MMNREDPSPVDSSHGDIKEIGLSVYKREQPTFHETFSLEPASVISKMDREGDDIPDQVPAIALPLAMVGVERSNVPLVVKDPLGGDHFSRLSCQVVLGTALPQNKRGIHMSRIGDLVAAATQRSHQTLLRAAVDLAEALQAVQYRGTTTVELRAHVPFLEYLPSREEGGRRKTSLESMEVIAIAEITERRRNLTIGIATSHITACPCVQNAYLHARHLSDSQNDGQPLLTHSQRTRTEVRLSGAEVNVHPSALLRAMDRVVFRTCNTLPREAELALVFRAHRQPQFIEDAVRAVAAECRSLYPINSESGRNRRILVRSRSMESIHDHDIVVEARLHA